MTEKRRGIGLVVRAGAQCALREREKARFLKEEWPQLVIRMSRMGIDIGTLLKSGDLPREPENGHGPTVSLS